MQIGRLNYVFQIQAPEGPESINNLIDVGLES